MSPKLPPKPNRIDEGSINFRVEIVRIHEDNTKEDNGYTKELSIILKRLDDLAGVSPGISSNFRGIDDNMEDFRADTDRNTKYTL